MKKCIEISKYSLKYFANTTEYNAHSLLDINNYHCLKIET